MTNKELHDLIHNELIPAQQMFKSYEFLASNSTYHFDPKIFRKCGVKIQEVINIARGLAQEKEK